MPAADRFRENFFARRLFERLKIKPSSHLEDERPDCIFTSNGERIGMEITTSNPRDVFRAQKLIQNIASQELGSTIAFSTTNLRSSETIPSSAQLVEDVLNPANSSSEIGDCERAFCNDLKVAWQKKRAKLNEESYQRFDQNWLLIWDYDKLSECEETFYILGPIMKSIAFYERDMVREPLEFDKIYILCGSFTIEFTERNYRVWREPAED